MRMRVRESGFELLRIVSMLMVLAVHIDGASLGLPGPGEISSARDVWRIAVEALAIIGVNCFTMISGYFGIRLSWRGTGVFLFQCIFYSVGIYTAFALAFPARFSWGDWAESWLVISHTDLWYVPAYFCLMILGPVLNAGLDSLSRPMFRMVLALFVILNVWTGWWWGAGFNPTGYTVVQLVMVYTIARYIRLHCPPRRTPRAAWRPFVIYLLSSAGIALSALCLPSLKAFAYNSPLVLLSTVALFETFRSIKLKSLTVNYVARSAFAVYLIHKAPLIWGNAMRPSVIWLWDTLSLPAFTAAALAMMAAIYITAMAIDALRRRISDTLFSNPVHNK